MNNAPSLLPCQFCGGINIIHCGHHMYCHACGADGPDADSQHESEAIAAWNRRTPQPVVRDPLTDEQWQLIADLTDSILTRATKDEIECVIGITQRGGSNA